MFKLLPKEMNEEILFMSVLVLYVFGFFEGKTLLHLPCSVSSMVQSHIRCIYPCLYPLLHVKLERKFWAFQSQGAIPLLVPFMITTHHDSCQGYQSVCTYWNLHGYTQVSLSFSQSKELVKQLWEIIGIPKNGIIHGSSWHLVSTTG